MWKKVKKYEKNEIGERTFNVTATFAANVGAFILVSPFSLLHYVT